ncbi:hypothetical protein ACFU6I_11130 [Streptomyces sp. NPDC057486]|uniref:hypothetical protein n=1 Tax=Streptomyces sp. NPDC057486 TaxID=3346145 RepID=UPI003691967D
MRHPLTHVNASQRAISGDRNGQVTGVFPLSSCAGLRSTQGLSRPLLDIIGWTADEIDTCVALPTELGQFGAGEAGDVRLRIGFCRRWNWCGDTP